MKFRRPVIPVVFVLKQAIQQSDGLSWNLANKTVPFFRQVNEINDTR